MSTMHLTVPSMACAACAETITQAVQTVDPSASVQADLKTKHVSIESTVSDQAIKEAIAHAGYPVS